MYTSGGFLKASDWILFIKFHFQCPCSNSGDIFGVSVIKSLPYSCLETCSCFTNKQPDVLSFSYLVPLLSFVLISIDKKKIFCHCTLRLCFAVLSCLHTMQPRCVGPSEKQKGQRSAYIFCIFKPDIKRIKQNCGCTNIKMVWRKKNSQTISFTRKFSLL